MPGKLNVKVGWVGAKGELKEELAGRKMAITNCHDALRRDTASDALRRGFGNAERLNLAPTQTIGARLVYQNENCCPNLPLIDKGISVC